MDSKGTYSFHKLGTRHLQNRAGKAAERKGKRVSISQRQDQSLESRNVKVSLPKAPWEKAQ